MDNAKIKEIVITLENLDHIVFDGRYIETIHIGGIKHERSIGDYVKIEDFWLRVKPEGNIGFTKPDADPDDPSTWEYMDEITEHKFEELNTDGQVTQLNIRYTEADGQQERTEHYIVYSEDWSDDEWDNLFFNPCQHTHIDGEGSLFMVISKEHSLADAFPESLPDKTEIRERPVWAGLKRIKNTLIWTDESAGDGPSGIRDSSRCSRPDGKKQQTDE